MLLVFSILLALEQTFKWCEEMQEARLKIAQDKVDASKRRKET
eukprot:SAG31_NODE_1976_length_6750_cov_8.060893_7_plen_43_part_00